MNKAYSRIVWENYPSVQTPLNEQNLNKMDSAVNEIDDRVINMETTKADQSELLGALSNVTYNDQTGVFVFTWKNGNTLTVDLAVEKIPTSFSMSADGVITMTNADGTTYTADVSSLIKTYTFNNANGITWNVTTDASGNKIVKAAINDGSITEAKLEVNFLANCRAAQSGAEAAKATSQAEALVSEGYARGTQNGVDVPTSSPYYHNNAKYYSDKAGGSSLSGLTDTDIQNPAGGNVLTYDSSNGKWVNDGSLPEKVKTSELAYLGYTVPYEMPIQNYIDSNRVFHQRVGRVDLGTLTWAYNASGAYFNADLSDIKTRNSNMFCSIYTVYPYNVGVATMSDKSIKLDGSGVNRIYIKNASYTSDGTFKSAMGGVYLYYELATEITFNADGNEKIPSLEKHFEVNEFTVPHESLNLIPFPYADGTSRTTNGITFTVNADGSVVANGTATANAYFLLSAVNITSETYTLYGCAEGGGNNTFFLLLQTKLNGVDNWLQDYGNGVSGNRDAGTVNCQILIKSGYTCNNLVFKPTLVKGTVKPNCIGWENSSAIVGKALGKNLYNPIFDTVTTNGVTCEALGNGTYRLNGNATADALFLISNGYKISLNANTRYKLVGCPVGGDNTTYHMVVQNSDYSLGAYDTGNGVEFTNVNSDILVQIFIRVRNGKNVSNLVFKPMLTMDLNATYDDFEKYQGLTSTDATKYTKYAKIETDKYGSDFIPQYVDVVPSGTFFTEDEESNKSVLAQTVVFANDGFYAFAEDTPSADVRLRIGGVV